MPTTTLRRSALWLSLASMLPHLFCCMLPTVAALIALGTTVGLAASLSNNPLYLFIDTYHAYFLIAAVVSTVISGALTFISWRVECRAAAAEAAHQLAHGSCTHGDCAPKKSQATKIFIVSAILLTLDVAWYLSEEHLLGLHNHGTHSTTEAPHHDH